MVDAKIKAISVREHAAVYRLGPEANAAVPRALSEFL